MKLMADGREIESLDGPRLFTTLYYFNIKFREFEKRRPTWWRVAI